MIEMHAGVRVDDFGLILDAEPSLADLMEVFTEAIRAKNRSGWIVGDAYISAEDRGWLEEFSQALDPVLVSLRTVQNCASTCRAFPKAWRKVPLSMSHYQSAAALVSVKPTEALKLLQNAYDNSMSREWVREQAALLLGETDTAIEVMLTWSAGRQVWIPDRYLELPAGTTRTLRIRQST